MSRHARIFCGSQSYPNYARVRERVEALPDGTVVIEGGWGGADRMARNAAVERGLPLVEIPYHAAQGKAGDVRRNELLLTLLLGLEWAGYEVGVEAFCPDVERHAGTRNMVTIAKDAGVEVLLWT